MKSRKIDVMAHEWLLVMLRKKKRALDNAESRKGADGNCAECERNNLHQHIEIIDYLRDLVVKYGDIPFKPMTLQEVCHCNDDDPIYCEYFLPGDRSYCLPPIVPMWGMKAKEIINTSLSTLRYGRDFRFWFGRKPCAAECDSAEWEGREKNVDTSCGNSE